MRLDRNKKMMVMTTKKLQGFAAYGAINTPTKLSSHRKNPNTNIHRIKPRTIVPKVFTVYLAVASGTSYAFLS